MNSSGELSILGNPSDEAFYSANPEDVGIEITGRCNLRCRHCFNESGPENSHELPLELIERFLDDVASWGVRVLRISGGEPTIHRHFREIIESCDRRGIRIGLNTNGIYSPEMLEVLLNAPIELFFVSLEGLEANHDAIRGTGMFRRTIAAIRELKRADRRVTIGFHVAQGNRADVAGLVALAAELGADFKMAPMRPIGRALKELPRVLIEPRDYMGVVAEVTRLRKKYSHIHILTDFDILESSSPSNCGRGPSQASCKAGRSMININFDGAILPCAFFAESTGAFSEGNVYEHSAHEVWRHPGTFQAFRVQRKSAGCQECDHYGARCVGGCPAIAHAVTGKLDAMDPTCFSHLLDSLDFANVLEPPAVEPVSSLDVDPRATRIDRG